MTLKRWSCSDGESFTRSSHLSAVWLCSQGRGSSLFRPAPKTPGFPGPNRCRPEAVCLSGARRSRPSKAASSERDCGLFHSENTTFERACSHIDVRCRSWSAVSGFQISSRNALQKQRSDESEREPSQSDSRGNTHEPADESIPEMFVVAAKGHSQTSTPRVVSWASLGGFRRRNTTEVACLARRGSTEKSAAPASETRTYEGLWSMEGALGRRTRFLFTERRQKRSWWRCRDCQLA